MRSVRDLSRPHLSLLLADPHMSTMRLWESLKWSLGKRKGLKRGLNRNSKMLRKLEPESRAKNQGQEIVCLGHGMGDLAVLLYRNATDAPATCHSGVRVDPPQKILGKTSWGKLDFLGGGEASFFLEVFWEYL